MYVCMETCKRVNGDSRESRKRAPVEGHSHHLQLRPAKRARPKATKGIPAELLNHVCAHGRRRRRRCKTPPAIANLRFKPAVGLKHLFKRVNTPLGINVPQRDLVLSTNVVRCQACMKRRESLTLMPARRLRRKTKLSRI